MTSETHKGLLIISQPMWYPDQEQFGAIGKIQCINGGNGTLNHAWITPLAMFNLKEEAHKCFVDFAKKYIDDNELRGD